MHIQVLVLWSNSFIPGNPTDTSIAFNLLLIPSPASHQ